MVGFAPEIALRMLVTFTLMYDMMMSPFCIGLVISDYFFWLSGEDKPPRPVLTEVVRLYAGFLEARNCSGVDSLPYAAPYAHAFCVHAHQVHEPSLLEVSRK
jgi:hypothetical protein